MLIRSFKDDTNREWTLRVSVGHIARVRESCQLDLPKLFDGELRGLAALLDDPVKLTAVLTCLLKKELALAGLGDDHLAENLSGDCLKEAGDALCWAVADFFPGKPRGALHDLLRRLDAAGQVLAEEVQAETQKENIDALKEKMRQGIRKSLEQAKTQSQAPAADSGWSPSGPSGAAPESSGSTPPPSLSAS